LNSTPNPSHFPLAHTAAETKQQAGIYSEILRYQLGAGNPIFKYKLKSTKKRNGATPNRRKTIIGLSCLNFSSTLVELNPVKLL
jgi:hypothetical protein